MAGEVPTQDLLRELGDAEIVEREVRTVVSGRFADQAALHGFLNRLRAYGLEVVEVRRVAGLDEPLDTPGTDRDTPGTDPDIPGTDPDAAGTPPETGAAGPETGADEP